MSIFVRNSRGDTIVEVMLATVIMSTVLTTAYVLSNRATKNIQDGFERNEVVQYLQTQAEYLRVARNQEDANWDQAKLRGQSTFSDPTSPDACENADLSDTSAPFANPASYHMQLVGGTATLVNGAQGPLSGSGFYVWIDTIGNTTGGYNTFVINACWPGLSSQVNFQTGLVVRMEVT